MIDIFETTARRFPEQAFLCAVDESGSEITLSYRTSRLLAATMARRLRSRGLQAGDTVAVELSSGQALPLLLLAAAYGSFSLVMLPASSAFVGNTSKLLDLEREGISPVCRIDGFAAQRLLEFAQNALEYGMDYAESLGDGLGDAFGSSSHSSSHSGSHGASYGSSYGNSYGNYHMGTHGSAGQDHRSSRGDGRSKQGDERRRTLIFGAQQDAIDDSIHFAEREAHLFDASRRAVILFTSADRGKSKAVAYRWQQLTAVAHAASYVDDHNRSARWQLLVPFTQIEGLQAFIRAVLKGASVRVYERFDANRVLWDAVLGDVSHLVLNDSQLDALLENDGRSALAGYESVFLASDRPDPALLDQASRRNVKLFVGFSRVEMAGLVAVSALTKNFDGGLDLLPGNVARIVDPDEQGFGSLAVRGPANFEGYLNGQAAFTVDGCFLPGVRAALYDGKLYLKDRVDSKLRQSESALDQASFERASAQASAVSAGVEGAAVKVAEPILAAQNIQGNQPVQGIQGVTARSSSPLVPMVSLNVERAIIYKVKAPLKKPFVTARSYLTHQESLLLRIMDHTNRFGLGECTLPLAYADDGLRLEDEMYCLEQKLIPLVRSAELHHPRDLARYLRSDPSLVEHPFACAAVEMALWDLYAKVLGQPFWCVLGQEYAHIVGRPLPYESNDEPSHRLVAAGAVVGLGTPIDTVETVRSCIDAGYSRVKLKIRPGQGLSCVQAIRAAFPQLLITLDANQSFTPYEADELRAYDALDIAWIEEPLDLKAMGSRNHHDAYRWLSELQQSMATPLCIDESYRNNREAWDLLRYPELRLISIKIGKFGGVEKALNFVSEAIAKGKEVWMGGTYDTGISRRIHAAFQTLPGIIVPGDIGGTSRYLTTSLTTPPYATTKGHMSLNESGYETGIGCDLNKSAVDLALVERVELGDGPSQREKRNPTAPISVPYNQTPRRLSREDLPSPIAIR